MGPAARTAATPDPPGSPEPAPPRRPGALAALSSWPRRTWGVAALASVATFLVIGLPTDVIPNPVFGRPVEVTWWAPWILAVTAVLSGLVAATYVRPAATPPLADGPRGTDTADGAPGAEGLDRPGRLAGVAGLLGFFAVGCPVCNKLVVVALGTSGAMQWFAPLQPVLAVASVVALAVALRVRLRGQVACAVRPAARPAASADI